MNGMVNAYVDGNWQCCYTAEEFHMAVLDKIAKNRNLWHSGYSTHLYRIFSDLSSTSVTLFAEDMSLIDCVWKDEKSGFRIDIGGEPEDHYYFVIKIGPKYGLELHGIGEAKSFDAKSCQLDNEHIPKDLEGYLSVVMKAVNGRKELNDIIYKAKMAYTTRLNLLGVNANWRDSGHTDLL